VLKLTAIGNLDQSHSLISVVGDPTLPCDIRVRDDRYSGAMLDYMVDEDETQSDDVSTMEESEEEEYDSDLDDFIDNSEEMDAIDDTDGSDSDSSEDDSKCKRMVIKDQNSSEDDSETHDDDDDDYYSE